jgi:hypothetical protein
MDQKLGRIRILMDREAGYYEPTLMKIDYAESSMAVSIARGMAMPQLVATVHISDRTDHFAELTKLVNGNFVDGIVMENCSDGAGRDFRFAVQRRYGLPVQRRAPASWQVAEDEDA